jgi:hypothetical protein
MHYNLMALEWGGNPYQTGQAERGRQRHARGPFDGTDGLPFLMLGGDGDLEYYGKDNIAVDKWGAQQAAYVRTLWRDTGEADRPAKKPVSWPNGVAGACRCAMSRRMCWPVPARAHGTATSDDIRVLFFVAEGRGSRSSTMKRTGRAAIPSAGADPRHRSSRPTGTSNTMEPKSGLYPGQKGPIQESLSARDKAMREGKQ